MYVLDNVELKNEILYDAHISAYAIHPGGTKMYLTIRPFYFGRVRKEKSLSMSASQSRKEETIWIDAATSCSTVEMGKCYHEFCVQASSYTGRL